MKIIDEEGELISSGLAGSLNQRIQGTIAGNVAVGLLMSEQVNGAFLVEVPSRNFAERFMPNDPELPGYVAIDEGDLPDGLAGSGDAVFITDLGASPCRPTQNPTCGRPGNSSGGGVVILIS